MRTTWPSSSALTARRLCGATPTTNPRDGAAATSVSSRRENVSGVWTKRRWLAVVGTSPKPPCA